MKELLKNLKPPVLLLGIGNTLKGDDAAGPEFITRIKSRGIKINSINCGETPENYIKQITSSNAKTILFIDAVEMSKSAGTVDLFSADKISNFSISTHGMSLSMLAEFIKTENNATVYLLGIQPKSIKLGEKLSPEVDESIENLINKVEQELCNA